MSLFGGPALHAGDAEVSLSQYQAALLGIVYGQGRSGISRSRLIWLLWEEDDGARSRHRLSQLLYALGRKAAPDDLFVAQGDVLTPSERVGSDLSDFDDFLAHKQVGAAAALLQNELLSALSAPTREMDDWKGAKLIALRSRLRDAAASLWSEAEEAAKWTVAREAAETLFALDPQSESYLRCVMRARALCGAPEEAEAAYRSWAELVPPSVGAGAADLLLALETWRRSGSSFQPPPADPAFVGRKAEAAVLRRALKPPASDEARTVLVTGEAGIGKTRLIEEVCRDLIAGGVTVIRTSCSSLEQEIPLNPLIDVLRDPRVSDVVSALDEPWRSVILDLLPETDRARAETPYIEPSAIARRLFESVRRLLAAISRQGAVLWIDDSQWVDHTTAAALDFALRRWDVGRLVLLFSVRTPEEGTSAPGNRLINNLRTRSTVIELEELAVDEAARLASSVLGRRLPPTWESQVVGLTGNVPLYIVEVAHELAEGRMLLDETGDSEGPVPVRIQEVVHERLALLQPIQRWVLELIAVGIRLPIEVVGATIREPEGVLLDALDRLTTLRLITRDKALLSCKHDLIRQGIYGSMSAVKRTALNRRIAESLVALDLDQDPSQLAIHFDRAEMPQEAFRFAKAAAERAEETGAAHEAIRFLRIARRNAPDAVEATRLLSAEAGVRYRQAELDQSLPLLTIAEQDFRARHAYREAVACGIKRTIAALELGALDHSAALENADHILDDCEARELWEQYIEAIETRLLIVERANDVQQLRLSLTRLAQVPPTLDPRVECLANSVRALELLFGDGRVACAAAEAAYRATKDFALQDLEDRCLHRLFLIHSLGGTLNTRIGDNILQEGLRRAAASGAFRIRYMLIEAAGVWHLESGDLLTAERYMKQAEDFMRAAPELSDRVNVFGNLAELHAMLGDFERACAYYLKARDSLRPQDHWRLGQLVNAGVGYCAMEIGNLRLARECEAKLEYTGEAYFDPWIIVLFRANLYRRRGEIDRAIQFVRTVAAAFEGRMRIVVIKLRLLEARLCKGCNQARGRELLDWVLRESEDLRLPKRYLEAQELARIF